jgi:hypothetical protein
MKHTMKLLTLSTLLFMIAALPLRAYTLRAAHETPVLDGMDTGDWTGGLIVTANGVLMKAAYDRDNLYILTQWIDASMTESIRKDQWRYLDPDWSQSGNEDRIAIMWDIGTTPQGASCENMCHPPRMYTSEGTVDLWHWKATRTNPMGYADDYFMIAIQDTVTGGETQFGDGGNNTYDGNGIGDPNPAFMASTDPNALIDFLLRDTETFHVYDPYGVMGNHTARMAVTYVDSGWQPLATVAGYVFEIPNGSRADVRAAGRYQPTNGIWTVEFMRSLKTTGPNDDTRDVQFDPGGFHNFTVALWDHSGGRNHEVDTESHRLVFGAAGIGNDRNGPGLPTSFALSQNCPNPFNPSTTIRYSVPGENTANRVVELQVFSLHGRLVRTLVRATHEPGNYAVHWDGTDDGGLKVPSGLYIYRLTVGKESLTRKMALLK